jgi:hypothetical protein
VPDFADGLREFSSTFTSISCSHSHLSPASFSPW